MFESINEADAAGAVVQVLDLLLREVGSPMTYNRASAHPNWPELETKAAAPLTEMELARRRGG